MRTPPELKDLERKTYKATHSDGAIDVFVGVSMVLIGVAWVVIPGVLSGVTAGVAISISPFLAWRRRFIEARTGYVVFAEPRRLWERRIYTSAAVLFGGFMLLARPLGDLQAESLDWLVGPDTLVVWLVAVVLTVLAAIAKINRLYVYSLVLAVAGAAALMVEAELGWPLIVSGAVVGGGGFVLMARFVNRHPHIEVS